MRGYQAQKVINLLWRLKFIELVSTGKKRKNSALLLQMQSFAKLQLILNYSFIT